MPRTLHQNRIFSALEKSTNHKSLFYSFLEDTERLFSSLARFLIIYFQKTENI